VSSARVFCSKFVVRIVLMLFDAPGDEPPFDKVGSIVKKPGQSHQWVMQPKVAGNVAHVASGCLGQVLENGKK